MNTENNQLPVGRNKTKGKRGRKIRKGGDDLGHVTSTPIELFVEASVPRRITPNGIFSTIKDISNLLVTIFVTTHREITKVFLSFVKERMLGEFFVLLPLCASCYYPPSPFYPEGERSFARR